VQQFTSVPRPALPRTVEELDNPPMDASDEVLAALRKLEGALAEAEAALLASPGPDPEIRASAESGVLVLRAELARLQRELAEQMGRHLRPE
jgi:hypothetical protein